MEGLGQDYLGLRDDALIQQGLRIVDPTEWDEAFQELMDELEEYEN